jgi:hypothetical protein
MSSVDIKKTPAYAIQVEAGRYVPDWKGSPATCQNQDIARKFKSKPEAIEELQKLKSARPFSMRVARVVEL